MPITTVVHDYDAPPELVFKALIEPEHLVKWSSAAPGWTTPFAEVDPRIGGKYRVAFGSPDGKNDFVLECTITEITAPERLAYAIIDGRPVTFTLTPERGKTRLTLDLALENINSEEQQRAGWGAMLDHLAEHLASL